VTGLTGRRAVLAALVRQHQRDIDVFDQAVAERYGLSRTDFRCLDLVLELVTAGTPVTPARLAEAADITPSTLTSVLDRLERAGYLKRVREQTNRRQVLLQLTATFAEVTEEIFAPIAADAVGQLTQFTDPEVETLIRFFTDTHDRRVKRTTMIREQTARLAADAAEETP
jgi:DNA-binding MarR family transcriptional regulator